MVASVGRLLGSNRPHATVDSAFGTAVKTVGQKYGNKLTNFFHYENKNYVEENGILVPKVVAKINKQNLDYPFCLVAAKLGIGLYFELTNRIVPTSGGVSTYWTHVQDSRTKQSVEELIAKIPGPGQLKQGRKVVDTEFFYRQVVDDSRRHGAFLMIFYESLALVAEVSENRFDIDRWRFTFAPDPLHGFTVVSESRRVSKAGMQ